MTAAKVAVKMDKLLRKELELELYESIFWTDSIAVLKYLNSEHQIQDVCRKQGYSNPRSHSDILEEIHQHHSESS